MAGSPSVASCAGAVLHARRVGPANHVAAHVTQADADKEVGMTFRNRRMTFALPAPSYSRETSMAHDWPLRTFLELGAYPEAIPCARLHARAILWEWGLTALSDQVELIVSELLTNAVHASQALRQFTPVRFWLLSDKDQVLILMWDASPQPPSPVEPTEESEGGRGLMLVNEFSKRWSWYFAHEVGGKIVWALCSQASRDLRSRDR